MSNENIGKIYSRKRLVFKRNINNSNYAKTPQNKKFNFRIYFK